MDVDLVANTVANESDFRLETGSIYSRLGDQKAAIHQYSLWLDSHPDDTQARRALNGRCWARALGGLELDAAVRDCNGAVRAEPGVADPLDSRGLVQLRRGRYADAIADYDKALRIKPNLAWSLYGRGLAKIKSGHKDEGDVDIRAAVAIDKTIAETAKGYGVAP
jgi:tetratricopeptide (TPR) repeat protein